MFGTQELIALQRVTLDGESFKTHCRHCTNVFRTRRLSLGFWIRIKQKRLRIYYVFQELRRYYIFDSKLIFFFETIFLPYVC